MALLHSEIYQVLSNVVIKEEQKGTDVKTSWCGPAPPPRVNNRSPR